ncbi:MAG: beta-phosphoglucomutase [Mobilitalea sp.]
MTQIKGLLFDLDGVIVDTAKYHYLAWKELADELGITFTLEDNERLKGVSRDRSFEIILEIGNVEMELEKRKELCEKKNNLYLTYINKMTEEEILPGVNTFLQDAKQKGFLIGLGSASKNSMLILEKLKLVQIFDVIVDGMKVSKAKPDPEVFTLGASLLKLDNQECLVFEDATAGIEAAHKGGMKAVGIGSKELLPEAEINIKGFADVTITDILEAIEKAV